MPTPSANYQASLNGVLMGEGTDFPFGVANISGLGNPPTKSADVQLDQQDGSYAAPDYFDARTLFVHMEISQVTDTAAFAALQDLKAAWRPTTSDIEFHIKLPSWGHIYYLGRPRSLEADLTNAQQGCITCIAEFLATDPFKHDA